NATASGVLDVRRGIVTQSSGLVAVDRLLVTNVGSDFQLNGGTLSARSSILTNGINVGNGVSTATFILAGNGTHVINGLVVNNNATLTGNGTISGIVAAVNNGTA